jgi:uncharacterized protein YcfL
MSRFATKITDGVFATPNQMLGLRLPDRSNVVGEYILGVSQAESIKNRADPSKPLTVQGTGHVYNPATVTVKSSATVGYGFITGIIPEDYYTILVIRKASTINTTAHLIGMVVTSTQLGPRQFGATNYFSGWGESANNAGPSRTRPVDTALHFEAGVSSIPNAQWAGVGGKNQLYWYDTGGVQQFAESPVAVTLTGGRSVAMKDGTKTIAIGSNQLVDTNASNVVEVAYVAIINRQYTPAEIEIAYRAIVAYYAARGVTVT